MHLLLQELSKAKGVVSIDGVADDCSRQTQGGSSTGGGGGTHRRTPGGRCPARWEGRPGTLGCAAGTQYTAPRGIQHIPLPMKHIATEYFEFCGVAMSLFTAS